MKTQITWRHINSFKKAVSTFEIETIERARKVADELAKWLQQDIKNSWTVSVSTPGNPPGIQTGQLDKGIKIQRLTDARSRVYVETNGDSRGEYSTYLEDGTRLMQARPFFSDAVERLIANAESIIGAI